jgi:hypothetical protein
MNKLLKEFLSYILVEERVTREPNTSWKTSKGWSAKRSDGETRSGFGSEEAANAWLTGTGGATGAPSEPTKPPRPPAQSVATPKKRGRPPRPTKDIQSVTDEIGEERVAVAAETLSRVLGPGSEADGDQKLAVLNGKIKSPGQSSTATGPVHEVSIGLVMRVLAKDPNLTDEQVSILVANHIKDTVLGQSLGEKKLLATVIKATKSARAEQVRVSIGIKNNGMDPKTTVTEHYHGNGQSKSVVNDSVAKLIASDPPYKIYTSDGIEIDPNDVSALIGDAGSSAHGDMTTPGDTFVLSVDPTTRRAILSTSSNKTERNDQSLNTTVLKELTDYRDSLSSLVQSGALSENELDKVRAELEETDKTISELSQEVSDVFSGPVSSLGDTRTLRKFVSFLEEPSDERTRKNLRTYYAAALKPFTAFNPNKKKMSKRDIRVKAALEAVGWKPGKKITQELATKAWVYDMNSRLTDGDPNTGLSGAEAKMVERFFGVSGGTRIDTTQIRTKALEALQSRHAALSNIQCIIDGQTVTAGQAVLGVFAVRALHLQESFPNMPGNSTVYTKYRCYFKAVTGDIVGYPESNLRALGVSTFGELCSGISLSEPRIARKTITFDIIRQTKEGQQRSLAYRVIRTKGGTALNITVLPSKIYTNALAENQPKV